jgi:hypothetical protein
VTQGSNRFFFVVSHVVFASFACIACNLVADPSTNAAAVAGDQGGGPMISS